MILDTKSEEQQIAVMPAVSQHMFVGLLHLSEQIVFVPAVNQHQEVKYASVNSDLEFRPQISTGLPELLFPEILVLKIIKIMLTAYLRDTCFFSNP